MHQSAILSTFVRWFLPVGIGGNNTWRGAHENCALCDYFDDFQNVLQLLQKYTYWLIDTYINMIWSFLDRLRFRACFAVCFSHRNQKCAFWTSWQCATFDFDFLPKYIIVKQNATCSANFHLSSWYSRGFSIRLFQDPCCFPTHDRTAFWDIMNIFASHIPYLHDIEIFYKVFYHPGLQAN